MTILRRTVALTPTPANILANLREAQIPLDWAGAVVSFRATLVGTGSTPSGYIDSFTVGTLQAIETAQLVVPASPKQPTAGDTLVAGVPGIPGDLVACYARGQSASLAYELNVMEADPSMGVLQSFLAGQLAEGAGKAADGPGTAVTQQDLLINTQIRQIPAGNGAAVSIAAAEDPPGTAGKAWTKEYELSVYFNDRLIADKVNPADFGTRGVVQIPDNLIIDEEAAVPGEIIRLFVEREAEDDATGGATWSARTLQYRVNVELL